MLALSIFEDAHCPHCGQLRHEAQDPDLAGEWTTSLPIRDFACTALARADERAHKDKREHPGALRYVVGLRPGAVERKAALVAARAERAAASEDGNRPERGQ